MQKVYQGELIDENVGAVTGDLTKQPTVAGTALQEGKQDKLLLLLLQ